MNSGAFNGITEGLIKAWALKAQAAAKPAKERYKFYEMTTPVALHRMDDEGKPNRKVQTSVKYRMDTKKSKDYRGAIGPREQARAAKRRQQLGLEPVVAPILEAAE
jgi:hypothetical protein